MESGTSKHFESLITGKMLFCPSRMDTNHDSCPSISGAIFIFKILKRSHKHLHPLWA